ncbi:hypothetical protein T484DRAFT_3633412 [Baffinella frigidus]|nr:hypothetical protein T484DRAFT_3633412 [Cryptophyta sp. CCMP2293]
MASQQQGQQSEILGSGLQGGGEYPLDLSKTNGFIDPASNPFTGQPPHLQPPAQQAYAGAIVAEAGAGSLVVAAEADALIVAGAFNEHDLTGKRLSFKTTTDDGRLRCVELLRILTSTSAVYRADMKKGDICSKGSARACLSRLFQDSKGDPALNSKQFGTKWRDFESWAKDRLVAIGMGSKPVDYGTELNTLLDTLHARKDVDDRRKGDMSKQKAVKQDQRSSALQNKPTPTSTTDPLSTLVSGQKEFSAGIMALLDKNKAAARPDSECTRLSTAMALYRQAEEMAANLPAGGDAEQLRRPRAYREAQGQGRQASRSQ